METLNVQVLCLCTHLKCLSQMPEQEGASETEIGAIRCSKMGKDCQIFEKLVGIDDEHHTM